MKKFLTPALIAVAALALTGCANETTASPVPAKTASTEVSASPSSTPSATEAVWNTFTSEDGVFSFKYPADWTTEATYPEPTPERQKRIEVAVRDSSGATVASLSTGATGLGGACENLYPFTALDTKDLDLPHDPIADTSGFTTPRFQFSAIENPNGVTASIGILNIVNQAETCMIYNVFALPEGNPYGLVSFGDQFQSGSEGDHSALVPTFANLDEARAFMETDNYKKLKTMFTSLTVTEN